MAPASATAKNNGGTVFVFSDKSETRIRKLRIARILTASLVCAVLTGPALADDGCENESNDRIAPELALCSVHAYNIGISTNPAGADKQLMKEIVALKTTIITQQMNKQYEYMDAMIRRFKTQLEKAVLTTKLQAAGAAPTNTGGSSSSGGSSYGGSGGSGGGRANNGLANAEDCMNSYTNYSDTYQCLLRNVAKISSAVTSGDLGMARRQLATDLTTLGSYNRLAISCGQNQQNCSVNVPCQNALSEKDANGKNTTCATAKSSGGRRDDITACIGQMRACIVANNEALSNNSNQQSRP
ncbi:MAG: hypothetical protein K2L25_00530 [Alphaproteobacteria bacterium]|nr:hypothetical protein [Alphaproteobacteria bacterium]